MRQNTIKSLFVSFTIAVTSQAYAHKTTLVDGNEERPKVQLAILLDTSGSMNGLIDQAKTQLWKIVNSFAKVKKNDKVPEIYVALYEYGNSGINLQEQYVRQLSPLTDELDIISEKLFSLKTNGGSEFCGAAIKKSLEELKWDSSSDVYKAIFIAGNEPFTQGPVSSTESCQRAIQEGIVVNAIHCGAEAQGINGGWKAGAIAAEGDFLIIDQDKAVVHIQAPQDKIIIELSKKLNETYIPYGTRGAEMSLNQELQDSNALKNAKSGAPLSRALTKGGLAYTNSGWDLVDLSNNKPEDFEKLEKSALPTEMVGMTLEEVKEHVAQKNRDRKQIQAQINTLNKEREAYVSKEKAALNQEDDTLGQAITKAVYSQVIKNGFQITQ